MGYISSFAKSWKKSGKLKRLQKQIVEYEPKDINSYLDEILSVDNEGKYGFQTSQKKNEQQKLIDEYIEDICLKDDGVRIVVERYGLSKEDLNGYYSNLVSSCMGMWIKGHYLPLSTIAYFEPLLYLVESQKRDVEWGKILGNLISYWEGKIEQGQLLGILKQQFDEAFEKDRIEYYRIGFDKIPDEFFSTQSREKAEKLFQEGLSETIGGLALQKIRAAAELGHLKAINHLKEKGFYLYIDDFTNKIHFF